MGSEQVPLEEQVKIRITSASDLITGLRHPERNHRIALLRAIRNEPDKALSFGKVDGRDIIDELLALCAERKGEADRWEYVFTTLSLNDERTIELAKSEFIATYDHKSLVMAAKRLSLEHDAEKVSFLVPVLLEDKDVNRCRLCANLLAGNSLLEPRAAIRVAALADRTCRLPPLNSETFDDWITELLGPYPGKTRSMLLAKEDGSFAALLAHWKKLPDPVRLWTFQEAVKADPSKHESLIRDILRREEKGELLLATLESLPRLSSADYEELITPFYQHADPAIRAAAIRVGLADHDWVALLRDESSDLVRAAIVARLGQCKSPENLVLLAHLLEDANWRVRAAATNSMVALAPASLPALHKLLLHPNLAVRAAAVQALKRLGRTRAWRLICLEFEWQLEPELASRSGSLSRWAI